MTGGVWTLTLDERPFTVNEERRVHWREHRRVTAHWRDAFAKLARAQRVPRLDRVAVDATPIKGNRRAWPDVGACMPAAKAAIDGLVDAGVIPDDTDRHVVSLTFHPARLVPKARDGFELRITRKDHAS
jgi:hypothetical protein